MDLLTMLDDKSSHKTDLDTSSRHYRRSGSLKSTGSSYRGGSRMSAAEQSRRAQASATRQSSIEDSIAKIIHGGSADSVPMAKY
jgi:hypothetical protein